jgi:imidazolonepropionase-like amidohydrolase
LALRAARAVSHGFDKDAAFEALTGGAARLLGVEKQIGRLKKGLRGDVVIWSDHPFAPGAKVERVFVGGREVFRADAESE